MDDLNPVERRRVIHERLDELLDNFQLFENAETEAGRKAMSRAMVSHAAGLANMVCGPEITALAYGPPPDDRAAMLKALAARLHLASELFGTIERASAPGSLTAAAQEAVAVAKGDEPHMFAKVSRYKVNYRLSVARLRALEWNAYLDGVGIPAYQRQANIGAAYQQSWDTIRKWDERARAALGDAHVDDAIRIARLMATNKMPFWGMRDPGSWQTALDADGVTFGDVARANKDASG